MTTQLTGDQVRAFREAHGMSRREFSELAGWPTQSRLSNIETKDSWKAGDQERIADVMTRLGQPTPGTARRTSPRSKPEVPFVGDGRPLISTATTFDEEDETAFAVVSPSPYRASRTPVLVDLPTPHYGMSVLDAPDGTYVVSNSETETYKRCPRKWWLGWFRMLTMRDRDYTGARAIGDRVHRALAYWYVPDGQPRIDPRDALERIIVDDLNEMLENARTRGLDETRVQEMQEKYEAIVDLERAMIEGYVAHLAETGIDSEYRVIAPEQALYADMPIDPYEFINNEPSNAHRLRSLRLVGRLDARLQRLTDGARLFDDHKTAADIQTPQATLHGNPQMLNYLLLEWLNTPEGEARCDGALYNMLKKVKRTDKAKPPFYDRVVVQHNDIELENHKRELLAWTRQILRAVDALNAGADHHDVVPRAWREDCRWSCDFFPICPMFDDGSRVEDAIAGVYTVQDPRVRYADILEPGREIA